MSLETFLNRKFWRLLFYEREKYPFGHEKKVVRISGKTTATLACSKTANIIIITLKTLNDMGKKNRLSISAVAPRQLVED